MIIIEQEFSGLKCLKNNTLSSKTVISRLGEMVVDNRLIVCIDSRHCHNVATQCNVRMQSRSTVIREFYYFWYMSQSLILFIVVIWYSIRHTVNFKIINLTKKEQSICVFSAV